MLYIFWFLHQTTTLMIHSMKITTLYIFWFLHQTTTKGCETNGNLRCISFDSYIKPQLHLLWCFLQVVVYLLIPTSNHNSGWYARVSSRVVYLLIPTSNHNSAVNLPLICLLYIFWFLHQTTTANDIHLLTRRLYIFWFLHQTTTRTLALWGVTTLYIFWFLHQTTTHAPFALVKDVLYIFWFLHQTTTRHSEIKSVG